jgi:hypothetical protein
VVKSKHLVLIASLVCAANLNGSAQSPTLLVINVLLPSGNPAPGVKVQQLQLERACPKNLLCGVTNNHGQLTVRLEPEANKNCDRNDWGVYRFVLMPENLRWELSDIYYWNKYPWNEQTLQETGIYPKDRYQEIMREPMRNWSIGNLIRVQEGTPQIWNVTLQRGEDVRVSVVDQFGDVMPRSKFRVLLDTDMLSHTGSGGEIPMFSAQTDEKGNFVVPHAAGFVYSFDYQCPVDSTDRCEYCCPRVPYFTTVVSRKIGAESATITYHKRIPQTVSISVIDKATKLPIPGAAIFAIMVFNSSALGGPPIGMTDANGQFKTDRLLTEHVLSLGISKENYQDFQFDMKNFRPGATYVFDLQPK